MRHGGAREHALGRTSRWTLAVAMVLAVAALAPTATATTPQVEILKSVSPPNPFPDGCDFKSIMLLSEFEPSLAVNPRNPDNLVTAWMQGHRESGGAVGVVGAVTRDRGRRWRQFTFPRSNRCTGDAEWESAGDPWLSFGPEGRAYFASLSGKPGELPADPVLGAFEYNNRLTVHRSGDGGRTWTSPVEIPQPLVANDRYPDRPILTADPRRPGRAYLLWTLIDDPVGPRGTYFSRTTDGGRTWSPAKLAFAAGNGDPYALNELLVLDERRLLAVGAHFTSGASTPIEAWRSSDGGETWSGRVQLSDEHENFRTYDPDTRAQKFEGGQASNVARAPDGAVYVAWQDTTMESSRILLTRSGDFGRSWTAPRSIARCRCQAFKPLLAATGDGTLGVIYYDDRNDRPGDDEWTVDVWFLHSHDRGRTWDEMHLGGPFDYRQPPGEDSGQARHAYGAGDYATNRALPGGFGATFFMGKGQARQGPGDIFFARVRTSPRAGCLARRSPLGRRGIGRVRLRYTRRRLLRLEVSPRRRGRRSYRYCVKRSRGRVVAVFSSRSRRGRVRLVTTTARGHGNRRVRPGSRASRFRRAYPRRRRLARGLYRAGPRSPLVFVVRRRRVRLIAVADRRLIRAPRALSRYLRLAGARR